MGQFQEVAGGIFRWVGDSCNVYVIRVGERATLVDIGSGSVLHALDEIGVKHVDKVLLTQHFREQTTGAQFLGSGVEVVAPHAEAELLANPRRFFTEEIKTSPYTVGGSIYVRPPRFEIPVTRRVRDAESFEWEGLRFDVYETAGPSPGAVTYVLDGKVGFSGNVCLEGGTLFRLFDAEWDYGYAAGMIALNQSVALLQSLELSLLCPSHGEVVRDPEDSLRRLRTRLSELTLTMLRDYTRVEGDVGESLSRPTAVPGLRQISDHLFVIRTTKGHNAYIITSQTGKALFVDCGLFLPKESAEGLLDRVLVALASNYGVKTIDAVVVTHYHGDHLRNIPYLTAKTGAQVWAYHNFREILESPEHFNLVWMLPAYGDRPGIIPVDRAFEDGEIVGWEEFRFEIFHCPGQTPYALGISGEVDGRKVVFTGDNMFYSQQGSGHDAYSMYNHGGVMENGYLKTATKLKQIAPDLVLGGHSQEIANPMPQIEKLYEWSVDFTRRLGELSWWDRYEYAVDPFWARFLPYRVRASVGEQVELTLEVRNYYDETQPLDVRIHGPEGWELSPLQTQEQVAPQGTWHGRFALTVPRVPKGIYLVAASIALGEVLSGEYAHALLIIM